VTWTLNNGGASNATGTATSTIDIVAVNNPPTLSNVSNALFTGTGTAVTLAPTAQITDPDNLDLASATVAITGGTFAGDGDVLAATGTASIAVSYTSATETLTLTGNDTLADYQSVVDGVTFDSTSQGSTNAGADPTRTVTWTLNDGSASNATGTAMETVTLSVKAPSAPADFYGNGFSDLLFQNTAGGYGIWQTNGTAVIASGSVGNPNSGSGGSPGPGPGWSEIGTADFNTGANSDILFENTGGTYALWDMNGPSVSNVVTFGNPGAGWSFAGIGDFFGGNNADILFENTTGNYAIWETNGSAVTGVSNVANNPGPGWSVAGIGDFNTGTDNDILFESTAGSYALWDMNGGTVSSVATLGNPGTGWNFEGIGNFDGSGQGDILFQNTGGSYAIWETNGTAVSSVGTLGSPGAGWSFGAIGDYNGDGTSDILFQNSSAGATTYAAWEMNGTTIANVANFGSPGAGWALQHTG
jgi:hypothetical protein